MGITAVVLFPNLGAEKETIVLYVSHMRLANGSPSRC